MKYRRQRKIVDIIRDGHIETQEELAAALKDSGFNVTQATISRDIKELGLLKAPIDNSLFCYVLPGEEKLQRKEDRLRRYFRENVVGVDVSENIIVVKTNPGGAQVVASAIDQAGWDEIIGTVGGDDTILVVVKPSTASTTVRKRFESLL